MINRNDDNDYRNHSPHHHLTVGVGFQFVPWRIEAPTRHAGCCEQFITFTLPETNTSPLKIGLPNRKFMFQPSIFRGHVSFREAKSQKGSLVKLYPPSKRSKDLGLIATLMGRWDGWTKYVKNKMQLRWSKNMYQISRCNHRWCQNHFKLIHWAVDFASKFFSLMTLVWIT